MTMSFSMAIINFALNGISESRPISKACQRVIDSKFSVRSSEREQRILAASRSARWALVHREREAGFEFSQRVLTRLCRTVIDSVDWSVCDFTR